jgi:hypothetical protein
MKKTLLALAAALILALGLSNAAQAQVGSISLFKLVSGAIVPVVSTWTFKVTGLLTGFGGFTGPTFTATSTVTAVTVSGDIINAPADVNNAIGSVSLPFLRIYGTYVSTTQVSATKLWEDAKRVCLADGTNCPIGGSQTLDQTLILGASSTHGIGLGFAEAATVTTTKLIFLNASGTRETVGTLWFTKASGSNVSSTLATLTTGWFTTFSGNKLNPTYVSTTSLDASGYLKAAKLTATNASATLGTIDTGWFTKITPTNVSSTNLNWVTAWGTKGNITYGSSTAWTTANIYGTKSAITYASSTGLTATTLWSTKANLTYVSSTGIDGSGYVKGGSGLFTTLGVNSSTQATSMFTGRADATKNMVAFSASTSAYIFRIDNYGTVTLSPLLTRAALNFSSANGNITVGGNNARRTIVLSGAGAWAPTTGGYIGTYQTEMATNKQNMQYVAFSSTTIQGASWTVIMPDNYDGGTITATYYFTATSSVPGNVVWATRARGYINGDAIDQAWGTSVSSTVAADGTANHVASSTASGAITIGGTPRGGAMVQFGVRRDGASANDTMGTIADLIAVRLSYGIKSYSDD